MKTAKQMRLSFVSLLLVLCMTVGLCPAAFALDASDLADGNVINYVSLGASNANGYGMRGYLGPDEYYERPLEKDGINIYGYKQKVEDSYPDLIADYFEAQGYTVNRDELAMSSMRAEELRFLLDDSYAGDAYTDWRFYDVDGDSDSQYWFKLAGELAWHELYGSGDPTMVEAVAALKTSYRQAITDADLITLDIGINNFGVYLSNQIINRAYDNDLGLIDPAIAAQYAQGKAYAMQLIQQYMGSALSVIPASDIEFIADTMAYALVGFCVNFDIIVEKIRDLNPDATIVTVSIQNLMDGLYMTVPGVNFKIPMGDMFGALINAANLYVAGLSPYSDEYICADVRADGHVDFYMDVIARYNGDPTTLDQNTKDCFDIYDNTLYIKLRVLKLFAQNYCGVSSTASDTDFYAGYVGEAIMLPGTTISLWDFIQDPTISASDPTLAQYYSAYETALYTAYDVMAEIISAAVSIDTLDFASFGQSFGGTEDALFEKFFELILDAVTTASVNPNYSFALENDFFKKFAADNGLSEGFVNTVACLGARTGLGNSFFGHPSPAGHTEIANAILRALANETTGEDIIRDELKVAGREILEQVNLYGPAALIELENYVVSQGWMTEAEIQTLKDKVNATIVAFQTDPQGTAYNLAVELAYYIYDKAVAHGVIDNDEVQKVVGWVNEVYKYFKTTQPDQIKADAIKLLTDLWEQHVYPYIEPHEDLLNQFIGDLENLWKILEDAKKQAEDIYNNRDQIAEYVKGEVQKFIDQLKAKYDEMIYDATHGEYTVKADSYYVALGGDTVAGTGILMDIVNGSAKRYNDLVAAYYGVETKNLGKAGLLPSEVVAYIQANAAEIQKADLITYQADASSIILGSLKETPDWNRYITADQFRLFEEMIGKVEQILAKDWSSYVNLDTDEISNRIYNTVVNSLPAEVIPDEGTADATKNMLKSVLDLSVGYVKTALEIAYDYANGMYTTVSGTVESIDPEIREMAEALVYACVAYLADTVKAVETIQAINPDASVLLVGMYNPLRGLYVNVNGQMLDIGKYMEYAIDATNIYHTAYAILDGKITFVDVSDAQTNGIGMAIDTAALSIKDLASDVLDMTDNMHANAAGHVYIYEQIIGALDEMPKILETLNAIEWADISMTTANDTASVTAYILEKANAAIAAAGFEGVTLAVKPSVVSAVAGSAADNDGTNGSASFTIAAMKNGKTGYADPDSFAIKATLYNHTCTPSDWMKDASGHWKVCTDSACGAVIEGSFAAHVPGAPATETTAQLCTVCGYEINPALGHTHVYTYTYINANSHLAECACNHKYTEPHNFVDGLCICGAQEQSTDMNEQLYLLLMMMATQKYSIKIDAAEGGLVIPSAERVKFNGSVTLTILPQSGYTLGTVLVNGKPVEVNADGTLTIKNIRKTQNIEVSFERLPWVNPYADIDASLPYYDAVKFLSENGIMNGVGADGSLFAPELTLTRAMFVTMLGRLHGIDPAQYTAVSFGDVKAGEWYAPYVEWAAVNGISTGYEGYGVGEFGINDEITVEQAVTILARYAKFAGAPEVEGASLKGYADAADVADWAVDAMEWAIALGVYAPVGSLNPQAPATRAMTAVMIYNFIMAAAA